jgi:hypothetical protein
MLSMHMTENQAPVAGFVAFCMPVGFRGANRASRASDSNRRGQNATNRDPGVWIWTEMTPGGPFWRKPAAAARIWCEMVPEIRCEEGEQSGVRESSSSMRRFFAPTRTVAADTGVTAGPVTAEARCAPRPTRPRNQSSSSAPAVVTVGGAPRPDADDGRRPGAPYRRPTAGGVPRTPPPARARSRLSPPRRPASRGTPPRRPAAPGSRSNRDRRRAARCRPPPARPRRD